MIATIFSLSTGRILRIYSGPQPEIQCFSGEAFLVGEFDGRTKRVNISVEPYEVVDKTPVPHTINKNIISADSADSVVIGGVPMHATVVWPDGQRDFVNDGLIEFATDMPGAHEIRILSAEYLDTSIYITAG